MRSVLWAVVVLVLVPLAHAREPLGPGGACCLFGGGCRNVADQPACNALGGVFLGGADCANDACSVGACCADDICNEFPAYPCITSGREFAGAGTTCAADPCVIGVGACCVAGACSVIDENACAAAGGSFLGAGAGCVLDPCDLGACCLPGQCVDNARYECDALGGTLVAGGTCANDDCGLIGDCPLDSLFAQSPDGPNDFEGLSSEASAGFIRFEDFSGVPGPIDALTWWGFDLEFTGGNFIECVDVDPTFTINFHEDAGGQPGALVCSYKETATRTPTGILYLGAELNEYSATLPSPCVLVNGWVSIVGLGDPSCWFLWVSSGFGGSWCDGCVPTQQDRDLAVCLTGTAGGVFGACCTDSTGACADGVEISDCVQPAQRFVQDTLCANLVPPCGVILGACCIPDATCTLEEEPDCVTLGGSWLGASTLCDQCPCITPCPPGGTPEGEPLCGPGYVDAFNGGCTAPTETFSPIAFNQTICGESGVYPDGGENLPDFDWYEIDLLVPSLVRFDIEAEFPAAAFVLDGSGGCPGATVTFATTEEACTPLSLLANVGPGRVWFVVQPTGFTDSAACGARYVAELVLLSPCAADFDANGTVGFADLNQLLGVWGPCAGCPEDLDGNGTVGFNDLNMLLGMWGPCSDGA